jgi:hypothetical protein
MRQEEAHVVHVKHFENDWLMPVIYCIKPQDGHPPSYTPARGSFRMFSTDWTPLTAATFAGKEDAVKAGNGDVLGT